MTKSNYHNYRDYYIQSKLQLSKTLFLQFNNHASEAAFFNSELTEQEIFLYSAKSLRFIENFSNINKMYRFISQYCSGTQLNTNYIFMLIVDSFCSTQANTRLQSNMDTGFYFKITRLSIIRNIQSQYSKHKFLLTNINNAQTTTHEIITLTLLVLKFLVLLGSLSEKELFFIENKRKKKDILYEFSLTSINEFEIDLDYLTRRPLITPHF